MDEEIDELGCLPHLLCALTQPAKNFLQTITNLIRDELSNSDAAD